MKIFSILLILFILFIIGLALYYKFFLKEGDEAILERIISDEYERGEA